MSRGANEISKWNDTKPPEARENAGDQDAIGLRLKSDWWGKKKRVFLSVVNIHMGDCLEQKHITTEFLQMKFGECFSPDWKQRCSVFWTRLIAEICNKHNHETIPHTHTQFNMMSPILSVVPSLDLAFFNFAWRSKARKYDKVYLSNY